MEQPPRPSVVAVDQVDRNSCSQGLADAILRSLGSFQSAMESDAQIGSGLDHLAVPCWACDVAQTFPVGDVGLSRDAEFTACDRKRVIHSRHTTMDDDQVRAISRDQSIDDSLGQLFTAPVSVAGYQDTHVHIVAERRSAYQPSWEVVPGKPCPLRVKTAGARARPQVTEIGLCRDKIPYIVSLVIMGMTIAARSDHLLFERSANPLGSPGPGVFSPWFTVVTTLVPRVLVAA
jgi:hypothetical protein